MKALFLDFDGVLINRNSLMRQSGTCAQADPACVAALNRITDSTGAKIVVSSTWRLYFSNRELAELLKSWSVTGEVIGSTPTIYKTVKGLYVSTSRTYEIGSWLKNHRCDEFVVLDDDGSDIAFKSNLVHTEFEVGLTEQDANRAIEVLNGGIHATLDSSSK